MHWEQYTLPDRLHDRLIRCWISCKYTTHCLTDYMTDIHSVGYHMNAHSDCKFTERIACQNQLSKPNIQGTVGEWLHTSC